MTPARYSANADAPDTDINFTFHGRQWTLRRPANLESLWEAISDGEFAEDERLPYWVELWPAALALAEWLTERRERLKGRICLDMGCGLGFTALTAAAAGARVLAMDYERQALVHCRQNAAINAIASPLFLLMDWRRPAIAPRTCDFIWAADILYEKRFAAPVLDFLGHALAPDGRAWLADPGRNTFEHFRQLALERGFDPRRQPPRPVRPPYAHKKTVDVTIWELGAD